MQFTKKNASSLFPEILKRKSSQLFSGFFCKTHNTSFNYFYPITLTHKAELANARMTSHKKWLFACKILITGIAGLPLAFLN